MNTNITEELITEYSQLNEMLQYTLSSILEQSETKEIQDILNNGVQNNVDANILYSFITGILTENKQKNVLDDSQVEIANYFIDMMQKYLSKNDYTSINSLLKRVLANDFTTADLIKMEADKSKKYMLNMSNNYKDFIMSIIKLPFLVGKSVIAGIKAKKKDSLAEGKLSDLNNYKDDEEYQELLRQIALAKLENELTTIKSDSTNDLELSNSKNNLKVAKNNSKINDLEFEADRKAILKQMMQDKAACKAATHSSNEIVADPTWNIKLPVENKNIALTEDNFSKDTDLIALKSVLGCAALNFSLSGILICAHNNKNIFDISKLSETELSGLAYLFGFVKGFYSKSDFETIAKCLPKMFKCANKVDFKNLLNTVTENNSIDTIADEIDFVDVSNTLSSTYRKCFGDISFSFGKEIKQIDMSKLEQNTILTEGVISTASTIFNLLPLFAQNAIKWIGGVFSVFVVANVALVLSGVIAPFGAAGATSTGFNTGAAIGLSTGGAVSGIGAGFLGALKSTPEELVVLTSVAKKFSSSTGDFLSGAADIIGAIGKCLSVTGVVISSVCDIIVKAINKVITPTINLAFNSYEELCTNLEPRVKQALELANDASTEALDAVRNITTITWNTIKLAGADAYNELSDNIWLVKTKLDVKKQKKFKEEIAKTCPYLSIEEIDKLIDTCDNKHITAADSKEALNYYNKQAELIAETLKLEKLTQANNDQAAEIKNFSTSKDNLKNAKEADLKKADITSKDEPVVQDNNIENNSPIDIIDYDEDSDKNELTWVKNELARLTEDLGDDIFTYGTAGIGAGGTIGSIAGGVVPAAIGAASGGLVGIIYSLLKYVKDKKTENKDLRQDKYIKNKLNKIEKSIGEIKTNQLVSDIEDEYDVKLDTTLSAITEDLNKNKKEDLLDILNLELFN